MGTVLSPASVSELVIVAQDPDSSAVALLRASTGKLLVPVFTSPMKCKPFCISISAVFTDANHESPAHPHRAGRPVQPSPARSGPA